MLSYSCLSVVRCLLKVLSRKMSSSRTILELRAKLCATKGFVTFRPRRSAPTTCAFDLLPAKTLTMQRAVSIANLLSAVSFAVFAFDGVFVKWLLPHADECPGQVSTASGLFSPFEEFLK